MKGTGARKAPWIIISILLLGCVIMAIATRMSFTDISTDPNLLKAPYWYSMETPTSLQDNVQDLKDQSQLIALVKPQGERTYRENTFKTKVEVISVYQGAPDIKGKEIYIYEPISLQYTPLDSWLGDTESLNFIQTVFPTLSGKDNFISANPQTDVMCYHGPMDKEKNYLVFLTPKEYPKESSKYQQKEEYNFIESIYAMIDTSVTKDQFVVCPKYITIQEASGYPVLLYSRSDLSAYVRIQEEIKNSILGD